MITRVSRLVRHLRRTFLQFDTGDRRTPSDFSRAAVGVAWLTRFFYLFATYSIITTLDFSRAFRGNPQTDPLWSLVLLRSLVGVGWLENVSAISILAALIALLAVIFPGVLIWRLGVFLYLFLFTALQNSYGAINHGIHLHLYISFTLLFLPPAVGHPERMSRKDAMACIMVFWFTQSVLLLSYSLAGFWKVLYSRLELFAPDGMIRVLLSRTMSDTIPVPPLLPFIAQQEYLAQFLLLGVVYTQLFAIFALFRPHLHRPFGIVLILFHFGTDWLINVPSPVNVVFVGLFLVLSPLAPAHFSLLGMMQSLPILGIPFRLWAAAKRPQRGAERAWLVYDGECPFCKNYAHYLDVRNAIGEFVLVNAREGGPPVEEIRNLPYDLNDGMVLKLHGRYYFGSDALHVLALLSGKRGVFSIVNRLLFSLPGTAWMGYPLLKLGRRLALRLKGVSLITK